MVDDCSCQARRAENTDPRTHSAVKYATARGRPHSEYNSQNASRSCNDV